MVSSYIKIAWRNILRSRGYSFINIFGLSLGIACSLLMFNYVRFELSYDKFHPDVDRTYRVDRDLDDGQSGSSAPPLAFTMKSNYPEVEDVMRINTPGDFIVRYDAGNGQMMSFNETKVFAADSGFFSFFGLPLKEGNPRTALLGVNKVVLSEETARKFFGDEPALGKILQLGDARTAIEVTGVTRQQPAATHFHFDYLLSMETNPNVKFRDWSWVWTQVVTYVRLKSGSDPRALESKMAQLGEKVIRPAFEARGMNFDNSLRGEKDWVFLLTPMTDIHLLSGDNRIGPVGDVKYVYTFGVIGVFVLLIAAINFINLATARGTKRAKEVGVKKTMGAVRSALVTQFQIETIFLTVVATILALIVLEALQLLITDFVGIAIPFTLLNPDEMLWMLPLIPIIIGVLAGVYPSFYLTAFQPAHVLKGKVSSSGSTGLRNGLVIVQFTISIALIASTLIVFQQLNFIRSTNLGFDRENILIVKNAEKLGTSLETYREQVANYPGVVEAGITMEVPGGDVWSDGLTRENSDASVDLAIIKTDESYFRALSFELVAGRAFEKERPSDRNAIILNETAVSMFGLTPDQAVGQALVYPGNDNTRHEIIGVMKDFHYQSLREPITALMFCKPESEIWGDWRVVTVKFNTPDVSGLLERLNQGWNRVLNDTPFEYSFLDEDLATQYQTEQRLGGLFGIFSGLSILIAIIGLVGLVSFSAEVRKKEIGIRKVFGASTAGIVFMMNRQYIRLVVLALLVAVPFTWWAIAQWLNTFEFKIEISPVTFVVAALAELVLAFLSVGYLSLRAATMDPSKVLREE